MQMKILSLTATLAVGLAGSINAQDAATPVDVDPCRLSCGIVLVPVQDFGEDSGLGMLEVATARARMDVSGRVYVAGSSGSHVWVFGPDGAFLTRIGRQGPGPGEFQHITSLVVIDDGVFAVLDRAKATIMTFDWTGELIHEVRTQGWVPTGLETIHVEGKLAVHQTAIPAPEHVGYPLHLVDLESGEIRESFGSLTGEQHLGQSNPYSIAHGPGRSVWLARGRAYEIELWESNRRLRAMQRRVDWFPNLSSSQSSHGWDEKPGSALGGIAADDTLLWVLLHRADERWSEASAGGFDWDLFLDTMVEVIDWRNGRVVASGRLDEEYVDWIAPGLLGRLVVTPSGSVRYRTFRVELDTAPEAPSAAAGSPRTARPGTR